MPKSRLDSCDAGWLHLERPVLARNAALAGAKLGDAACACCVSCRTRADAAAQAGTAQLRLGDQALREAVEAALLIKRMNTTSDFEPVIRLLCQV